MSQVAGRIRGVYVVTDRLLMPGRSHVGIAEAAVLGKASCVQLREKDLPDRELLEVALAMRRITRDSDTLFIVNNRVDIAMACDADGVHVGQDDLPAGVVRKLVGPDMMLGVSAGSADESVRAVADGADYIGLGPIFPTATKSDAGTATGLDAISEVRRLVSVPVVAIGGISAENIGDVARADADSAAVVSAVVCASDMVDAVRKLAAEFERGRSSGGTIVDTA